MKVCRETHIEANFFFFKLQIEIEIQLHMNLMKVCREKQDWRRTWLANPNAHTGMFQVLLILECFRCHIDHDLDGRDHWSSFIDH